MVEQIKKEGITQQVDREAIAEKAVKEATGRIFIPPIDAEGKEKEYDVGRVNRAYFAAQEKGILDGFGIKAYGRSIYVNMKTGEITINGTPIKLEIPKALREAIEKGEAKLRFIHFKRHTVSRRIGGTGDTHHVAIAAGWQTTWQEKNYQRFVLVHPDGRVELHKKR